MALQDLSNLWTKIEATAGVKDHLCLIEGVTLVRPIRVVNLVKTITELEAPVSLKAEPTACPTDAIDATT